ncbi:MAG: hypothetical protein AVDCRST_MAG93-9137, partial [uncultured Chloroflexia bacterium]
GGSRSPSQRSPKGKPWATAAPRFAPCWRSLGVWRGWRWGVI